MTFCIEWCESSSDRPHGYKDKLSTTSLRRFSVESALRRDYLLFKLHQLSTSKTAHEAETVLRELDQGLVDGERNDDNHDTSALLQSLNEVTGAIAIIHNVLNREEDSRRPSALVAAPLLYKFARHGVGFDSFPTPDKGVVSCEPIHPSKVN